MKPLWETLTLFCIPEDIRMNVTSSSKRCKGQISKTSEGEAIKELWSFIDPREFDSNDVTGFAVAKKKLRQVVNEFTL